MGKLKNFIRRISGAEKRSFIKDELSVMGPGTIPKETKAKAKAKKGKKNGK